MLAELNYQEMIVPAGHKPLIAIEGSEQVFRRFANLDAMAGPNFNCLRVLHSPHGKRVDRLGVKYAFQEARDRFGSGMNRLNRDDKFLFQVCS